MLSPPLLPPSLHRTAIPFDSPLRESLGEKYGVQGIPRLVVLNGATGAIVDDDARAKVTAKKTLNGLFKA